MSHEVAVMQTAVANTADNPEHSNCRRQSPKCGSRGCIVYQLGLLEERLTRKVDELQLLEKEIPERSNPEYITCCYPNCEYADRMGNYSLTLS